MYRPDPGGNFASEVHRRVACALPDPDEGFQSLDWMMERVGRDDFLNVDQDEFLSVVEDLEADGDATKDEAGSWQLTEAGHEALTGNNAWNGGREYGASAA